MKTINKEVLLNELFELTCLEYYGIELTNAEKRRYVEIVDILHENDVEINFGIEI